MRNTFDQIVVVDVLKGSYQSESLTRDRGYAVDLGDELWFFFNDYEPAFAFGRSARMSEQVGGFDIREAVAEVRFSERLNRNVRVLFVGEGSDALRAGGRDVLQRFVEGVSDSSAYWRGVKK